MSKVVKLSDFNGRMENIYTAFMTEFWEDHDLYWELSNGGFYLWSAYVDAGNPILLSDMKTLAAAANLLIIEYNKDRILEEGHAAFIDHMALLASYYQTPQGEITKMSVKLKTSISKLSLDLTELEWDDEADDSGYDEDDDFDDVQITPEMIKHGMEIMNRTFNFHVRIDFDKNLPLSKEAFTQVINDYLIDAKTEVPIKLYQIYFNDTDITFSIDCQLVCIVSFTEMMEEQYQVTPEYEVIRDLNENAFIPNDHYIHFMEYYRDMVNLDLKDANELKSYIEKFDALTPQQRRKQNPNAKEDDDFAAILLYNMPLEQGIENAKAMLKSNRHNIEAQLLIAGAEGDLEKRIDMLTAASDIDNLNYDYKQIDKDKMWWGASHTRPFMRAKYLLAQTYEFGGYIDDAIDGYEEIIEMNPNDNLGARLELIRILYRIGDRKEMVSLVNKYPDEVDEYFSFAGVYASFMKHGKSSKTEKKIIFSLKTNYYLSCAIAKIDAALFTDLLDAPEDKDEILFDKFQEVCDDIIPLFKNAELLKYYSKIIRELFERINN